MKPEEALDNLNNKILIQGRRNGKYLESEMMKVIIESLKKQIPKKVKFRSEYLCGNCNVTINSEDCYCFNCGQKINWEETP